MQYICNPVNINYRYQFNLNHWEGDIIQINREAADPSMICFQGKYYIFASMTLGVWVSEDLASWENHKLPDNLPCYDYAPDVRVMGEYVYFTASKRGEICNFYRTKDIINGPYEEIEGTFDFWDPNIFVDDDGRVYFFWGCTNTEPIWGVELDPRTMKPIGEKKAMIYGDPFTRGYERIGEDHTISPATEEEIEEAVGEFTKKLGKENIPEEERGVLRSMFSGMPYIEGAWLDKFNGRYYLQYAATGAEINVYLDGVFVADSPLGPYKPARNNPYSYKPGGFLPGAGHGSTMVDLKGNMWHTATMRISTNHRFERRVGIWPAGLDQDGELFCNQRYGDWPLAIGEGKIDPWSDPKWFLLSCNKAMTASSSADGHGPELAAAENVQTCWQAASNRPGEWLMMDLGAVSEVHAIQINFADVKISRESPGELRGEKASPRYIDDAKLVTRWKLEGSADGADWFMLADKWNVNTDLSHDLIVMEDGIQVRFIRLTINEVPYEQNPAVSGLRVFGIGSGEKPQIPEFEAVRIGALDMDVKIKGEGAVGYNILWGHAPEKLYHNYMIFENHHRIGALVKGQEYYVRVDAFNEVGITEGNVVKQIR